MTKEFLENMSAYAIVGFSEAGRGAVFIDAGNADGETVECNYVPLANLDGDLRVDVETYEPARTAVLRVSYECGCRERYMLSHESLTIVELSGEEHTCH